MNDNEKLKAIKELNVQKMKELLNETDSAVRHFQTKEEFTEFTNDIDLCEFTGLSGNFDCILIKGNKAHIYETTSGRLIYVSSKNSKKRRTYSITNFIYIYANCTPFVAVNFIKKIYNVEVEDTEQVRLWKQEISDFQSFLTLDSSKQKYPNFFGILGQRLSYLYSILEYSKTVITDEAQLGNRPIFFASIPRLLKCCGKTNRKMLSTSLTIFALLRVIRKLNLELIPKKYLSKSLKAKQSYGYRRVINYFYIPVLDEEFLNNAEEIATILKDNSFSYAGISREYILRTFGIALANEIYPQYIKENSRGTSNNSNKHTEDIEKIMVQEIERKKYVTEAEVIEQLKYLRYTVEASKIQIKRSLQEILDRNGLEVAFLNKRNRELYQIPECIKYGSKIICKMDS